MPRWTVTMTLAAALASLLAACGGTTAQEPASSPGATDTASRGSVRTITSADVAMPTSSATRGPSAAGALRIVSLATGVGETLAALGASEQVVGRDETSDVPSIRGAPIVTKAHAVSAERVLALEPDLVLVDASTSPPEALDQIRAAGVRVVEVPEAWTSPTSARGPPPSPLQSAHQPPTPTRSPPRPPGAPSQPRMGRGVPSANCAALQPSISSAARAREPMRSSRLRA